HTSPLRARCRDWGLPDSPLRPPVRGFEIGIAVSGLIWLEPDTPLPEPDLAMPEGLLAAGNDLSIPRLTEAYSKGIFPWFNQGDPVLWWSPDPRMVLACAEFKASRSLAKKLRQMARLECTGEARVIVTTDLAFDAVIR